MNYVDIAMVSFEDEKQLWGDPSPEFTCERLHELKVKTVVVKLAGAGCLLSVDGEQTHIETDCVDLPLDTTGAGDAFNGAFLANLCAGEDLTECCRQGNKLGGRVIRHHGAIIGDDYTRDMLVDRKKPTLAAHQHDAMFG
ncbi:carbohydrate kinase family protein [Veronia nyctiphanis]|uniref:carbohydrate kinase family protein n=1 Tax=Veronia nyctiphanis TaxID=1278244 RepID=UPI001375B557|nr:PfkB family carbohydrate kinase [Veronia nyctiphanis]